MSEFFYWSKDNENEGFVNLSIYLKNPNNNKPGWYFAKASSYSSNYADRNGVSYKQMPVKFGVHHGSAGVDDAAKPIKMGKPGDYLVGTTGGTLQIMSPHEFALNYHTKTSDIPGQKLAEASITIETGPTGTTNKTTAKNPNMGSY